MATKKGWKLRKKRYGKSGVKNPRLRKERASKSMEKWHEKFGHSEDSKRKIGEANKKSLKGKHCSPRTEFKKGHNHPNWKGGKQDYWHKKAREKMIKAGFDLKRMHVHHIDHDITNNKFENLKLIRKGEHERLHMLGKI